MYAAKCVTNLFRSILAYQNQQQTCDTVADASLIFNSNNALIKLKTLPTLIRLASTYSTTYRGHLSSSSSYFTNQLLVYATTNTSRPSTTYTDQSKNKLIKQFGSLVLVDALATLTYLIESSADLQLTAAYLEQIIPSLVANVSTGFNNLRFVGSSGFGGGSSKMRAISKQFNRMGGVTDMITDTNVVGTKQLRQSVEKNLDE